MLRTKGKTMIDTHSAHAHENRKIFFTVLGIVMTVIILAISLTINVLQASSNSQIIDLKMKDVKQDELDMKQDESINEINTTQQVIIERIDDVGDDVKEIKEDIKELAR